MHPFQKYLPKHWNDWIKRFALEQSAGKHQTLGTDAFRSSLRIKFEDGSETLFQYAFYAVDEERSEVAVLTEHCGYHIFHLQSIEEFLDEDGNAVEPRRSSPTTKLSP